MAYIPPQSNTANFIVSRLIQIPDPLYTNFDVNRIAGTDIKGNTDLSVFLRVGYEDSKNLSTLIRRIDIAESSFNVEILFERFFCIAVFDLATGRKNKQQGE